MKRLVFEDKLRESVEMEQELGSKKTLVFTKIHCPFDVLCQEV